MLARRLWARFEVLPFRYGVAAGVFAVVVLAVCGFAMLGGGSSTKAGGAGTAGRARHSPRVEAALPPAPTWGAYVPPRKPAATPVPARPRIASLPPRARPSHAAPRPSPGVSCPPSLKKKWMWVWEMCKRKQTG